MNAWRWVFYISGAVYAFGIIFYGLLGSGEIQPWAKRKQSEQLDGAFDDVDTSVKLKDKEAAAEA